MLWNEASIREKASYKGQRNRSVGGQYGTYLMTPVVSVWSRPNCSEESEISSLDLEDSRECGACELCLIYYAVVLPLIPDGRISVMVQIFKSYDGNVMLHLYAAGTELGFGVTLIDLFTLRKCELSPSCIR